MAPQRKPEAEDRAQAIQEKAAARNLLSQLQARLAKIDPDARQDVLAMERDVRGRRTDR